MREAFEAAVVAEASRAIDGRILWLRLGRLDGGFETEDS